MWQQNAWVRIVLQNIFEQIFNKLPFESQQFCWLPELSKTSVSARTGERAEDKTSNELVKKFFVLILQNVLPPFWQFVLFWTKSLIIFFYVHQKVFCLYSKLLHFLFLHNFSCAILFFSQLNIRDSSLDISYLLLFSSSSFPHLIVAISHITYSRICRWSYFQ